MGHNYFNLTSIPWSMNPFLSFNSLKRLLSWIFFNLNSYTLSLQISKNTNMSMNNYSGEGGGRFNGQAHFPLPHCVNILYDVSWWNKGKILPDWQLFIQYKYIQNDRELPLVECCTISNQYRVKIVYLYLLC